MRGALNEMDRYDGERDRLKHGAARMSKVSSWPISSYSQALNRVESWKHVETRGRSLTGHVQRCCCG